MKKTNIRTRGFTLIELLVVSTIIVVLGAVGMVGFTSAGQSSRDAKRKADAEVLRQSLVLYRADTGAYPTVSGGTGYAHYAAVTTELIDEGYLSSPAPSDPKDGQSCGDYLCGYGYEGTATGFAVWSVNEKEGAVYRVHDPANVGASLPVSPSQSGDGGADDSKIPTPTPSATATPTPTPTPGKGDEEINPPSNDI